MKRRIGSSLKMNIFLLSLMLSGLAVFRVHSAHPAQEMEIRLMYGMDSTEGAVFMYKDERWWPICGESWTLDEAKVACNQLGFPYPYVTSYSLPDYIFINVSRGRNWLVGFRCRGYEANLKWCSYSGWGYCSSGLAAGVTCHSDTESDELVPKYVWVIFFAGAGCIAAWACYKKKREQLQQEQQQQLQVTTAQAATMYPSSMDESTGSSLEAGNQGYPSPVILNINGLNGRNSKSTTNATLPPSHNLQGRQPMATAPAETLNTTGIDGSVPGNPTWGVSSVPPSGPPLAGFASSSQDQQGHLPMATAPVETLNTTGIEGTVLGNLAWGALSVPPSAPPPAGVTPSSAYEMPDSLLQQGFPHYPTQDPQSHDMPPPPSYDEATHQNR